MKPNALQQMTISANFAISADGKISSIHHRPSGWTSRLDYQRLLELRHGADAIFVGRRTLLADQMSLTVPGVAKQPLRCIASERGEFTGNEKVFHTPGGDIHLWCRQDQGITRDKTTVHHGTLTEFLLAMHQQHGVQHLHCEGGGQLMRMLIDEVGVDLVHLTWAAHTLFGGKTAATISGVTEVPMISSQHYELIHFQPLTELNEVFLTYRRKGHQ
jgi:5-amino-6-(5-phosphoribosylamino)uracil reductase/2,5-diamino-6-(ribosylamino)-4(3H)-pyrimidinone 5'-phosphate reductase